MGEDVTVKNKQPAKEDNVPPPFPIAPFEVRFIKLGPGGEWEKECIEDKQIVRFGFDSAHQDQMQHMINNDWQKVWEGWLPEGVTETTATTEQKKHASKATNALMSYFSDQGNTLWVTFYKGDLYWCFLKPGQPISLTDDPLQSSYREVDGKWSCHDANGDRLSRDKLPGVITKVSMHRGTTCEVKNGARLVDRINGKQSPQSAKAQATKAQLVNDLRDLIGDLQWQDFEVLADLILSAGGWRRTDRLGGTEKTVDLTLDMPLTGERAFAQVKADCTQETLDKYVHDANERGERMFFVHNSDQVLTTTDKTIYVLGRNEVANLIVKYGLVDWLIDKTR